MQTSIEWLIEQMIYEMGIRIENTTIGCELFEQAKEMHKQEIMMAVKDSWYMAKGSNFQEPQEEQYYQETFKKD
jgi:hypothetical protein